MNPDLFLFLYLNGLPHSNFWDIFMLAVSQSIIPLTAAFFLSLLALGFLKLKDLREFAFLSLAFGVGFLLLNVGVKDLVRRPRPYLTVPQAIVVDRTEKDFSFPSGHSFVVACIAALIARKKDWSLIFFLPFSLLVGFSRIYLGVHYPSDVLVGLGLGFLYGTFLNSVVDKFIDQKIFNILKFHIEDPAH
ncbi:MAG: phosphatase PAP2 family protein [Patescibacteria group bacterium]|nr:phosphatase PAP2 family protein [Patescibacteria group bacterium]